MRSLVTKYAALSSEKRKTKLPPLLETPNIVDGVAAQVRGEWSPRTTFSGSAMVYGGIRCIIHLLNCAATLPADSYSVSVARIAMNGVYPLSLVAAHDDYVAIACRVPCFTVICRKST